MRGAYLFVVLWLVCVCVAFRAPSSAQLVRVPLPLQGPGLTMSLVDAPLTDTFRLSTIHRTAAGNPATVSPFTLVFIHGSFHGAWCWDENFLPFFASKGYNTVAVNLRGTCATGMAPGDGRKSIPVETHVKDLRDVLKSICPSGKAVVVAHSAGGIVLMKMLEESTEGISGAVWMCSVPPSGNAKMTQRFLLRRPVAAVKILLGFVPKWATTDPVLANELFFNSELKSDEALKYMHKLKEDSVVGLDVRALLNSLPSKRAVDNRAEWLLQSNLPKMMVLGAADDYIVDSEGVEETAQFVGTSPVMLPGVYHDVMLGPKWQVAADALLEWLQTL